MERIGKLNRRITVRAPGHGRDSTYGGGTETFLTSDAIWAGVEYTQTGSDEQLQADQLQSVQKTLFTIRYREGLSTDMEVVYEGLRYRIEAIQPSVDRHYMTLETMNIGRMWHSSLINSSGAELADASDNILVWMPGEVSEGYESPQLTFS